MKASSRIAAVYARVSTDKQNPLSPSDQVRKCREFAERNGTLVAEQHIYIDEGISGVGLDRPELQRLLQAALSPKREIDTILVDDMSRLSRSTESALLIFRKLCFAGVQLISVSQNINSEDEQAETLITFQGLMDSGYVRDLSKKTHRGCESAVLRGQHAGGRCYGYAVVPVDGSTAKRLVINETEAKTIKRIFEMSAAGLSLKSITKTLNAEHVGACGDWCPTGIRAMLKRELYKGELIWNRSKFVKVPESNKRRRKMRDESEWIRTQRPDLAIVSLEKWDQVQARLNFFGAKPSQGRRRGLLTRSLTSPYLFSGLLKCSECGANLIIATGGGTHRHPKYVCRNYFNRGTCKNDLYIRRDVLEERLLGCLQSRLLRSDVIDYVVSEFGRQLRASRFATSGSTAGLKKREEELEQEINRFNDAIACGGPLDSLVHHLAIRERELRAIRNELFSASSTSIEGRIRELRHFVQNGISDLRSLLHRDPALAKAELNRHLSEIRMTPDGESGEWHYVAEGSWNLVGTGPNAPVLGLAHSDGCGGQI
jgi:site-specific DNA recombinase